MSKPSHTLKNWTLSPKTTPLRVGGYPVQGYALMDQYSVIGWINPTFAPQYTDLLVQAPAMRDELTKVRAQVEAQARDLHAYAQRVTQLGRALFAYQAVLVMIREDPSVDSITKDRAATALDLYSGGVS